MELCTRGELFDRIVQEGHYSDKEAAKIIKTIVGVVNFTWFQPQNSQESIPTSRKLSPNLKQEKKKKGTTHLHFKHRENVEQPTSTSNKEI